jgi:hypothetical protein
MKKMLLVCLFLPAFHFACFAQGTPQTAQLRPVYVNGRWGYADRSGTLVIKPQFDAARPFAGAIAQVGVVDEELPEIDAAPNLKWGYIDERGRVVVELRYTILRDFAEGLAAAAVLNPEKSERIISGRRDKLLNLKWGYVDMSGREVIPVQFLNAGDFSEGLAHVNVGRESKSMCGRPSNYGYIDKTGAFVIKPRFANASGFQNGRARVSIGQTRYLGRCLCCGPRFYGKHGSVDRSGTFVADEGQADIPEGEFEGWEN